MNYLTDRFDKFKGFDKYSQPVKQGLEDESSILQYIPSLIPLEAPRQAKQQLVQDAQKEIKVVKPDGEDQEGKKDSKRPKRAQKRKPQDAKRQKGAKNPKRSKRVQKKRRESHQDPLLDEDDEEDLFSDALF